MHSDLKKLYHFKNGKAPHSLDSLISQIEKITNTDQFIVGQWKKKDKILVFSSSGNENKSSFVDIYMFNRNT